MTSDTNTSNGNGTTVAAADGERKRALITGITGQDGAYLTELLLNKGALGAAAAAAPRRRACIHHVLVLMLLSKGALGAAAAAAQACRLVACAQRCSARLHAVACPAAAVVPRCLGLPLPWRLHINTPAPPPPTPHPTPPHPPFLQATLCTASSAAPRSSTPSASTASTRTRTSTAATWCCTTATSQTPPTSSASCSRCGWGGGALGRGVPYSDGLHLGMLHLPTWGACAAAAAPLAPAHHLRNHASAQRSSV